MGGRSLVQCPRETKDTAEIEFKGSSQSYTPSLLTRSSVLSAATVAAKSLQPCPTLCDPIDGSPPGSAVPGILQATTWEWVAISISSV